MEGKFATNEFNYLLFIGLLLLKLANRAVLCLGKKMMIFKESGANGSDLLQVQAPGHWAKNYTLLSHLQDPVLYARISVPTPGTGR